MIAPELVRLVLSQFALDINEIHGPQHWFRVAANGRRLAAETSGADPIVIEHFALLHDSKRVNEEADRGHGRRAAVFIDEIGAHLSLTDGQIDLLKQACSGHDLGHTEANPTIGCCWDADRLDLSRLGRRPYSRLLSTAAAQNADLQTWAWERGSLAIYDRDVANDWGLAFRFTQAGD